MSFQRLQSQRPFPPYAYLPGKLPHPVRDAAGHSFSPKVPHPLNAAQRLTEFEWGVDLFNHGFYWEAHESWEPLWRAADPHGGSRHLLKGLILLAASGVKIRERKPAAAVRHAARAASAFVAADHCHPNLTAVFGTSLCEILLGIEESCEMQKADASSIGVPEVVFSVELAKPAWSTETVP